MSGSSAMARSTRRIASANRREFLVGMGEPNNAGWNPGLIASASRTRRSCAATSLLVTMSREACLQVKIRRQRIDLTRAIDHLDRFALAVLTEQKIREERVPGAIARRERESLAIQLLGLDVAVSASRARSIHASPSAGFSSSARSTALFTSASSFRLASFRDVAGHHCASPSAR